MCCFEFYTYKIDFIDHSYHFHTYALLQFLLYRQDKRVKKMA